MMQQLVIETEVIQISIYCNIIKNILKHHKDLSLNKIMVFAYLVKKEKFLYCKIYNGNNTQDLVSKATSLLAGEYVDYCNSSSYILKAIHLLLSNKQILIKDNLLLYKTDTMAEKVIYEENQFLYNAIEASKKITERQFMKEVMINV